MEETARQDGPAPEHSAGQLIRQLSEQVSVLVRDEMKLAELEMKRKARQTGLGIGMLGGSGVVALYAVGCLLASGVIAISMAVASWLAALIVGVALLAVAGVAALTAKARLARAMPPVPAQAIDDVKADVEEIKEKARR